MRSGRRAWAWSAAAATLAWTSLAGAQAVAWSDPGNDAVVRRTDWGRDGVIPSTQTLPDVRRVALYGWDPAGAPADPFIGVEVPGDDAHVAKVEVTFSGLINPPGPLGLGGQAYDPYRYGQSPVYGFIDLDVDEQKNTGGELGAAATLRYLANVGRFSKRPRGSVGERIAMSGEDVDLVFNTAPQYERTGAEFSLQFCGCSPETLVSQTGNMNGIMEAGETFVVRGRFFQRANGFVACSSVFGGSALGRYDPYVVVQFRHSLELGATTVCVVFALDMEGASRLTGQARQPIDLNVSNHTSVEEALEDIIQGAETTVPGPTQELVRGWRGRDADDYLDVSEWQATALVGVPYASPEDSLFAFTDTGFEELWGDLDGDEIVDEKDQEALRAEVYSRDGGHSDADGIVNGVVVLVDPGPNFSAFDTGDDAMISGEDLWLFGHRADLYPDARLDIFDFLAFQNYFAMLNPIGDHTLDQQFDIFDFLAFQNDYLR